MHQCVLHNMLRTRLKFRNMLRHEGARCTFPCGRRSYNANGSEEESKEASDSIESRREAESRRQEGEEEVASDASRARG